MGEENERGAVPGAAQTPNEDAEETRGGEEHRCALPKNITGTSPTVWWLQRVELAPHISQLTVEGIDGGVLLTNRTSKLQGGDVESGADGREPTLAPPEWWAKQKDP
jgi:hypothetical protein